MQISVQGPTSVGKSTLVRFLGERLPNFRPLTRRIDSPNGGVVTPSLLRSQPKTKSEYVSLYRSAVERVAQIHHRHRKESTIWDRGPEDLAFKINIHPRLLNKDWDPETLLGPE